ncbi:hypothetical protein FQN54_005630 [Arachnomyces sp. PD_36]|nr:hypothetical protein FQN54_005630 [Arachnomyces sp. PD_36]
MPWRPLPRIAFAVAIYPFQPSSPADLPLELGDELYIIEQGGDNGSWYRGYLVAPPSLLAGLTSVKGQTLEARVFSGIFPRSCVEVREVLGDAEGKKALLNGEKTSSELENGLNGIVGAGGRGNSPISIQSPGGGGDSPVTEIHTSPVGGMSDRSTNKKASQLTVIKMEDEAVKRRSGSSTRSLTVPMRSVSAGPLDPDAPKPAAPVPMLKIGDETPTSLSEPLVDEIASCLREWHSTNLHELLLGRQYNTLENTSNIVLELDLARRQLLHNVLTAKERSALWEETVWNLVRGNKMLSGEVIVRDPVQRGRLLTGDDSAIELTKLQSVMSMLDANPTHQTESVSLNHLLFEVNAVSGTDSGPVTLAIYLCVKGDDGKLKPLSETYSLEIPTPERFTTLSQSNKLKTIFTDLNSADIGSEGAGGDAKLYLVVKTLATETPRTNTVPSSRRSTSRDGALASKNPSSMNSAAKGSLKGRRSMMWGPKSRGNTSADAGKENAQPQPPSTARSTASREDGSSRDTVIRTTGVGVVEVGHILQQEKDVEQIINIWSPLGESDEGDEHMEGYDSLVPSLLYSPTGRYARSSRAARIHTHFYPFASPDAETLVRGNPTSLHNVVQTRRMGFSEAPTKPRSDIYLTISKVVISRDALLSHPQTGHIPLSQNSGMENLQLTLEVRDSAGKRIEHCIFASSNATGHTAWRTTVTQRNSAWNQTIRLNIPADQVRGAHLIMSVADAPGFPFALSWMPLWDQEAFLRDGPHSLLLHAYDKTTSSIENGKGAYLSLPWSALGKNESAKDEAVTGPLATLVTETYLCSTEYSQDQVILGLINWRDRTGNEVLQLLKRVVFVPEIEIVKQLGDVFDALFGILVENAGNEEYEDLIFNDLVMVLGIVHDRRFNLGPLVDQYAENQFNFPFATPCLIRSYSRLLSATPDSQQSRHLRAAFKVGRHLLKFIINAREQQKAKEEGIGITKIQSTFNRDLHSIFKSLEGLIQNSAPILVGNKTLVVQHFHTWLPELSKALSKEEILNIALSFMDACKDVKGMLVLYKIVLILNYTQLPIFEGESERKVLGTNCIRWLAPYWGATDDVSDQYRDQVRLCSSVVAEQLKNPEPEMYEYMPKIVESYVAIEETGVDETDWLSMLFSKSFPFQLKASKTPQKFDESLVELSALMAAIAKIPSPKALELEGDELALFLSRALCAHMSVLNCEAYPETWFSVHIYNHRATMKSLEYLSSLLIGSFLPAPDEADTFDTELWKSFFTTLLKLVSSDALTLETFPEQKRRAVWKIAGDVREFGADLLRRTWEAIGWDTTEEEKERYGLSKLGGYQVQYVPGLVSPIINLCLSVHEGLRRVAVEVLQTMIVSEWTLNEDLSMVEAEIISSLDVLFKNKHLDESITQKLFINELLDLFEPLSSSSDEADEGLLTATKQLVGTVDELLDLLVASHSGAITDSLHTLKLMEFMKDMEKEDIFIRYVHELAKGQASSRNYTEAGLALQLHADLYDWDFNKTVPALLNPDYPEQSSFERKESLYFQIIQHFEDGKAWAHALGCYRELAEHYEHSVLDFSKLARTQGSMARIYDSIVKDEKAFARYFRVTFKGLGFPPSLRDKQFIFEGLPSERMATFTDRMQKQHPAAQVVGSGEIEDLEGQFLQISGVSTHRDMNHPVYQRSKVPQSVREHLLVSAPAQFSMTSKRETGGNNVKEQWVAKTVFTTSEPFPNILRRSEIVSTEEVSLTPLQTAIERTWRKTQELQILEKRGAAGDDVNLNSLTEVLGKLLDLHASSPTCVASYREFFTQQEEDVRSLDLDGEEEEQEPPKPVDPLENALAVALIDHALAIKRCLALYSRPSLQATQSELTQRFEAAFAPEIASLAPSQMAPIFPDAVEQSTSRSESRNKAQRTPPAIQPRNSSPEQELVRSTRRDGSRKQSSTSNRISIMNPFKRSSQILANAPSHGASTSIHSASDLKAKLNGVTRSRNNTVTTNTAPAKGETVDDDAATTHSRATSRSRGGKSDTNKKRRSFFGSVGGAGAAGDEVNQHKATGSISAPATSTEDVRNGYHHNQRGAGDSKSVKSYDGRAAAAAASASASASATTGHAPKASVSASKTSNVGSATRPATSDSYVSVGNKSRPTGNSVTVDSVRQTVTKRFSLLRLGRKNSRMSVLDSGGGHGGGGGFREPLHEE